MQARTASPAWVRLFEALPSNSGRWIRIYGVLLEWQKRIKDRAALASLDDRMLKDIGVSRAAAWHEARKPFWKA